MDIQAYIKSGILELYVHGLASAEEAKEVEELASKHPEIQQEIEAIIAVLDTYAAAHAVKPPAGLKEKILNNLEKYPDQKPNTDSSFDDNSQTIRPKPDGKINWVPLALGMLTLALSGACLAAFLFYKQATSALQKSSKVQAQLEQLQKDCDEKHARYEAVAAQFKEIRHWATKPVQMKGTKLSESSLAIVYYNEVNKVAFLDVVALPAAPADKQYQLWAIVNGQPTDMGVFELTASDGGLQAVPFIEDALAFAVTLEPKGGSPSPTLDQMYVIGTKS